MRDDEELEHVRWIYGQQVLKHSDGRMFVRLTTGAIIYLGELRYERLRWKWWFMPHNKCEFYLLAPREHEATQDVVDIMRPAITGYLL